MEPRYLKWLCCHWQAVSVWLVVVAVVVVADVGAVRLVAVVVGADAGLEAVVAAAVAGAAVVGVASMAVVAGAGLLLVLLGCYADSWMAE